MIDMPWKVTADILEVGLLFFCEKLLGNGYRKRFCYLRLVETFKNNFDCLPEIVMDDLLDGKGYKNKFRKITLRTVERFRKI